MIPSMVSVINKKKDAHPVFMISRAHCPHVTKAKGLLSDVGAKVEVLEIADEKKNMLVEGELDSWRAAIKETTGSTSVPKIFLKGQFWSGDDDAVVKAAE